MNSDVFAKRREDEVVVQEIDGEVLVYDLRTDKAYCLNQTSSIVWNACDGKRTREEIRSFVSDQLSSDVGRDVVWLALQQLSKSGLIDGGVEAPVEFAGMSRRQLMKKIGLATAVALPVVASLVAPTAAHAASLCMTGASCTCPGFTPMGTSCPSTTCRNSPSTPTGTCRCSPDPRGGGANRTCL